MKIIISGHSGIGKTTLAREISSQYNIPFVTTSSKMLWEKEGITSQEDIIKKSNIDPQWGIDFQCKLLQYRAEELGKYDNYVTDRGTLDNLVYLIVNCSHLTTTAVIDTYLKKCIELTPNGKDVINIHLASDLNMLKRQLENDNNRVSNAYFQSMVNQTFEMVIANKLIPLSKLLYLKTWDFQHRFQEVQHLINSNIEVNKIDSKQFYKKK